MQIRISTGGDNAVESEASQNISLFTNGIATSEPKIMCLGERKERLHQVRLVLSIFLDLSASSAKSALT